MSKTRLSSSVFSQILAPASARGFTGLPRLVVGSLLALSLAACGGGGDGSGASFNSGEIPTGPATPPAGTPTDTVITPQSLRIGNGTGENFAEGIVKIGKTTIAASETTTVQVNVVDANAANVVDASGNLDLTVKFNSVCASTGLATLSEPIEISKGSYTVDYTNTGCNGSDKITASLFANGKTASVDITVVGPEVLTVSFVSSTPEQLSLAGIGGNESAELTFKVAGPQSVAIVGKTVNFSVNSKVGGASILAGRETAVTNAEGLVRTIVRGGTVAGPVNVLAVEAESGRQGLSKDIIISTGVPESGRFELVQEIKTLAHAFEITGIELSITAFASDTFGNKTPDGTRVSFVSPESGIIGSSCELADGFCSVKWVSGGKRPANMRIQILAYTDGAEQYTDNNGNSVFDAQDTGLIDLGEPFADENENGVYNLGEFFFDTNHDGVRNTGNGQWDGPCLVKVDPSAVCTGNNTVTIYDTTTLVLGTDTVRLKTLGTFPAEGTGISIKQGASLSMSGLYIADGNTAADSLGGNPPPLGTTISFSLDGSGATLQGVTDDSIIFNLKSPVGPYGVTVAAAAVLPADPLPTNARLVLNVTVPGRTVRKFVWPITYTR